MEKIYLFGLLMVLIIATLYYLQSNRIHISLILAPSINKERTADPISHGAANLLHTTPLCDNLLTNITDGYWIKNSDLVPKNSVEYGKLLREEEEYDHHLAKFRISRGMHTQLWREDGKCGYAK